MGKGIDLARQAGAGIHADVLDDFKDQLLVVFLKSLKTLGHPLYFPLSEIDDTGNDLVNFRVDPETKRFYFEIGRKS
jgi:hypothetical protein